MNEMDTRVNTYADEAGISDMKIEQALTWLVRKRDIDMCEAMNVIEQSDSNEVIKYSQQGKLVYDAGRQWKLQGEL